MSVAARARAAREAAGLSQGQAARRTQRPVKAIEDGRYKPNGLEIYDLAYTYGVSADWLEHGTPAAINADTRAALDRMESRTDATRLLALLEMGCQAKP